MGLADWLLAIFWFFLLVIWIWLLITVVIDMFRSDMTGWAKAAWVLFVIVVPWLGVLVYLIVHGKDMQQRAIDHAAKVEKAQREYIAAAAGSGSTADELEKLKQLHNTGVLTDDEFAAQKAKVLAA
jgi:thiosulfate reductase cytochrome b subunit